MGARPKMRLTFALLSALFLLESTLVIAFYVVPQFQSHEYNPHPEIALEIDTVVQRYPWLRIAFIAFVVLFLFGNVGLIVMIWRAFKNLRTDNRNN
jgi:hypothetical protein